MEISSLPTTFDFISFIMFLTSFSVTIVNLKSSETFSCLLFLKYSNTFLFISLPCPIVAKYSLMSFTLKSGGTLAPLHKIPHCFIQDQNSLGFLVHESFSVKKFFLAFLMRLFNLFLTCLYSAQSSLVFVALNLLRVLFFTLDKFFISSFLQGAFLFVIFLQTTGANLSYTLEMFDVINLSTLS